MNDYIIRNEKKEEEKEVEIMVRNSFFDVYRSGALEHYLLHIMRSHEDFIPELNFVMEKDEEIIGQSVCAKSYIKCDDKLVKTITLGPICIKKEYQKKGYGKKLLDYVFKKAKELGFGAVLFEGDIKFYGKSGCKEASRYNIKYPGISSFDDSSFFLCKELEDGYLYNVKGEYVPSDIYKVSEYEVRKYDENF